MMCHYLPEFKNAKFKLYTDLIGFKTPTELFNRLIPDIVLVRNNKLVITELTCCFETNFGKPRQYKINSYKNITKTVRLWTVHKIFVEVSSLGFVTKDLSRFKKQCKTINSINTQRLVNKMSEVAIRASYYLYTQRNSEWSNLSILKLYWSFPGQLSM